VKAQLLVVPDCPHERSGISLFRSALTDAGLPPQFDVVVVGTEAEAEHRHFSGSPSFHIDQADLFPAGPTGLACRVYRSNGGRLQGLPDRAALVDRLRMVVGERVE